MSIEGGSFTCFVHQFETYNVKKWDKHMSEIYHPLEVTQECKKCGFWNQKTIPHPERYLERMHSAKPEDQHVIVLKCVKCS